jgi:molybdate transport system substrate-binding protein
MDERVGRLVDALAVGVPAALVGPADLQQEVVFTAAVAANAREAEAARAFIAYLTTPDAKAVFKVKGMNPS